MADIEYRKCAVHGHTKFRFEKDIKNNKNYGKYRCSKCRQESKN